MNHMSNKGPLLKAQDTELTLYSKCTKHQLFNFSNKFIEYGVTEDKLLLSFFLLFFLPPFL